MNLLSTLYAIRKYGLKGIIDYLTRKPRELSFQRFLKRTLRSNAPECGVTLVACFDGPLSLSKVMRDLALMLKQAGIPYQALNIPCNNPIPRQEFESLLTPRSEFCLNKYTRIITMRYPLQVPDARCSVHCIEFWEFEDGFVEGCPEALLAQNVLALSNFDHDVFCKRLPKSIGVKKILYPFQFLHGDLPPRDATRRKYGINVNDFIVFFNFDYSSSYFRKNPEGILRAFAQAFKGKTDVGLVFKTMSAKKCKKMSDRLHALALQLGISSKLLTIDDFIPQEDLVNLTNACDVYMSLHRGEGFGLGVAEAMTLGKAVIVTDYSSTTEFCNSENSIPIPFKMIAVPSDQHDIAEYRHVSNWAEPDMEAATSALQRLYFDKDLRQAIGNKAKSFINSYFSIRNFKESVLAFINEGTS